MTSGADLCVRIVSIMCMVVVLALGLQSANAGLDSLLHSAHGDVAASDGGWVIADCHGHDGGPCGLEGDGGADQDGHHHHATDTHAAAPPPATPNEEFAALPSSRAAPSLSQRLTDADIGRPGQVPRVSIRLT